MSKTLNNKMKWLILISFFAAFVLTIVPLPQWAKWYRPEWVAMVLIYWCMRLPFSIGIGCAWLIGLLLDALRVTLLGQYALVLSIIAYLTVQLHLRLRLFPIWQQSVCVLLLISCGQLIVIWCRGFTGQAEMDWRYWMAALTSMLIWPWLVKLLSWRQTS